MDTKLIGVVAVILILVGVGGSYYYAQNELSNTASETFDTIRVTDVRFEDFSLFPPSLTVIGVYTIDNPTGYDLDIDMDLQLYTGEYFLTDFRFNDEVRSNGKKSFEIEIPIGSNLITQLTESNEELETITVNGDISVSGKILFYNALWINFFVFPLPL